MNRHERRESIRSKVDYHDKLAGALASVAVVGAVFGVAVGATNKESAALDFGIPAAFAGTGLAVGAITRKSRHDLGIKTDSKLADANDIINPMITTAGGALAGYVLGAAATAPENSPSTVPELAIGAAMSAGIAVATLFKTKGFNNSVISQACDRYNVPLPQTNSRIS